MKNKEAKTNFSVNLLFILFVENLNNTIDLSLGYILVSIIS